MKGPEGGPEGGPERGPEGEPEGGPEGGPEEGVQVLSTPADYQKVCDSLVNAEQKLGNVLQEGEHLLSSCMVDRRRLKYQRSSGM